MNNELTKIWKPEKKTNILIGEIAMSKIIDRKIIRCPKCQALQVGVIKRFIGIPWLSYVHDCDCGYIITESEWEVVEICSEKCNYHSWRHKK